jgi:hypothetical protein
MLTCTSCQSPLTPSLYNTGWLGQCYRCNSALQIEVFPAILDPQKIGTHAQALADANEASCFYHPNKKASIPCDLCGRFLCSLCDLEVNDRHLCPACLEVDDEKNESPKLKREGILYDSIALSASVLTTLIWPFSILSAPYVLYLTRRYYKTKMSVLPRSRWRFIVASVLSICQLTTWVVVTILIIEM